MRRLVGVAAALLLCSSAFASGEDPNRGSTMTREVAIDQAKMKRRYVNSKRHTIQVDFEDYLRTVSAERAGSRERATTTAG